MKQFTLLNKASFGIRKHSPEILIVTGIVGVITSAVMACKATTKVSKIMEKSKEELNAIHECSKNEELSKEYSEEDAKKDLTIVYVRTGLQLAKLYLPSILLGALSIVSILTSNNILRKRNIATAAAYATISKSFKEYRKRVVEQYGEEADRRLKYDIKAKKFEETEIDPETGETTTVEKEVEVVSLDGYSEYARFFDEGSRRWEKNSEYNLLFLRQQQNYANDKLRSNGHLFLNEVYDMLDIPRTKAGQAVGWVYDPKNPIGDNYVDFGIYEANREKARDFINGYERVILLDFNVDGNILDRI